MKIGIDLRGIVYDSATRGIGSYVSGVLEGLADAPDTARHEIVLFHREGFELPPRLAAMPPDWRRVPVPGYSWQDKVPAKWFMRIPKVRALPPLRNAYIRQMLVENRRYFEDAVRAANLDLIFLPSAVDLGSFPTGDFPCPRVSVFLDAIPMRLADRFYDVWSPPIREMYDAQLSDLRKAERVVAISDMSGRDAVTFAKVPEDRVQTIYCAVDERYYGPAPKEAGNAARARLGIDRPYLLFCSALDEHKNWRRILAAFAQLESQAQMVFVVKTSGDPYIQFQQECRKQGLSAPRVVPTGWLEDDELHGLIAEARAVVSPSLQEGFGLPAAQGLAAGVPTIGSTGTSLEEVVLDAGILVDPESTPDLVAAMEQMLNPAIREGFVPRCRPTAQRFHRTLLTQQLLQVFDRTGGSETISP